MKLSFRWYGDGDPVTLEYISQIPGMRSVVSAVYAVPPGEVWPVEAIGDLKRRCEAHGLVFDVVESVPVHEDIKLGKPSRERYIENYRTNIRRLGAAGVKVVCYNFMPVFDWLRSDLDHKNPDGSTSLIYREEDILAMDPAKGDLSLPGWDASYTKEGLAALLAEYRDVDGEALWRNAEYFLKSVIPVCEECGVRMAVHPDDPPWSVFGLPRIVTGEENLARYLGLVDSPCNGVTLCTGSLGANPENDLVRMIRRFGAAGRIPFVHVRNILRVGTRGFNETAHRTESGSLDIYAIMKALYDVGFDGYLRPDHGRMIWGEKGRPGYGLYDRALGAVYLGGLWEAIGRESGGK